MWSIIIMVASFSFQISGAVILLLWSLKKCDKTIKQKCIDGGSNWIEFGDSGKSYTTLSKDELQENARIVYLNIAAFMDIIIGYTCAIFIEDVCLFKWQVLLLVMVSTIIIIALEKLIVNATAKLKYSSDIKYEI